MKYQIRQKFSCFEEFNSFTHRWDADFSAYANEDSQPVIEQFASPGVLVNTGSYAQGTIQRGATPQGMQTFALPFLIDGPMYWRNLPIVTNCLMVFPKDRELYAVAQGPVSICSISVAQDLIAKQLVCREKNASHLLNTDLAVKLQASQWQNLHEMLHCYSEFVCEQGDSSRHQGLRKSLEEDLLTSLLDLALENGEEVATIKSEAAARNTQRALDYMRGQPRDPVIVSELCRAVDISPRVLELSFQKYLGQSPKQFSNHQRLRRCYQEFRKASSHQMSVSQVAMSWGFWHMGQFGRDYKKLFGQTPGTTLAE